MLRAVERKPDFLSPHAIERQTKNKELEIEVVNLNFAWVAVKLRVLSLLDRFNTSATAVPNSLPLSRTFAEGSEEESPEVHVIPPRTAINDARHIQAPRNRAHSEPATIPKPHLQPKPEFVTLPGVQPPPPSIWSSKLLAASPNVRHVLVEHISDAFEISKELGRGGFAVVYEGRQLSTGTTFALKFLEDCTLADYYHHVQAEICTMSSLNHPRIVRLHEVIHSPTCIVLVMDLVRGGELFDKIVTMRKFSELVARAICAQLIDALDEMHSNGIMHRDLKPENILIDQVDVNVTEEVTIKVTDFGLAEFVTKDRVKGLVGTVEYSAPELVDGTKFHGTPADMWSLGVILYILLSGQSVRES
eukprot:c10906_g1_i1.p1 GENE.c10906_g1_i1~~c10906_g1_i1.p1  ORF type:complete len:361 (-),score=68.36 c10906_g1_i1:832-1914(-)